MSIPVATGLTASVGEGGHLYQYDTLSTVNPFAPVRPRQLNAYEAFKLIVNGLLLFPLRMLLSIGCVIAVIITFRICKFGLRDDDWITGWRRTVSLGSLMFFTRVLLFIQGMVWIEKRGEFDPEARLIVANHHCFWDALVLCAMCPGTFVAMKDLENVPLVNLVMKDLQCILVDRRDPNSRKTTMDRIVQRCDDLDRPNGSEALNRLVIFPEATTTNGLSLINFKLGAFRVLRPVQPVVLKYPVVHHDVAWLNGTTALHHFRTLCQFVHHCEIEFLPLMTPLQGESPPQFANRVRRAMAVALNIPMTQHSLEDVWLLSKAENLQKLEGFKGVEFHKAKEICGDMTMKQVEEAMESFIKLDKNVTGCVEFQDFCDALNLPPDSDIVRSIFNMIDVNENGVIDFQQYLLSKVLLSKKISTDDRIQTLYDYMKRKGKGKVTFGTVHQVLTEINPDFWNEEKLRNVFDMVNLNFKDEVTLDTFIAKVHEYPFYFYILFKAVNDPFAEKKTQ
eukprot:CAMPEP_0119124742 /NCGR_PEP_ID=MMETSP1310-20130426/4272_1 /TAXON_ID=464262 /ORGANISM="Genus nov. species nov., Strain RCC2339" /LENGTH=506 /DNA_ID=CAMNT_0007114741 /DNA_START=1 /DNA_END=1521 /DNA_ORIENTATION=+